MNQERISSHICRRTLCQVFLVFWSTLCLVLAPGIVMRSSRSAIPGALLMYFLFFIVYHKLIKTVETWDDKLFHRVLSGLLVSMLILLLSAGSLLLSKPFSDAGTIYYSVAEIIESGSISTEINQYSCCAWSTGTSNNDYFLIYPKSVFLVAYLLPVMRTARALFQLDLYSSAGWYTAIVFNCISIAATAALGCATVRIMCGKKSIVLLFLLLVFCFLPNYINTFKVYSDTLSMPYMAACLYFMVKGARAVGKRRFLFCGLDGAALAIATLLKGSALVLLVSTIIWLFIREDSVIESCRTKLRDRIYMCACLCSVFAIILLAWNMAMNHVPWLDQSEKDRYELPAMHWIMMASKGGGGYRQEALDYSLSFASYEEKQKAEWEAYRETVQSYGSWLEYGRYIYQKICAGLSDGHYYQQIHMQRFPAETGIGRLVNEEGVGYPWLLRYISSFQLMIFFGLVINALRSLRSGSINEQLMIAITFFGCILFFCFWEFKSRYLMNYSPMLLMVLTLTLADEPINLKKQL